jgi:hypothetical protein
MVESLADIELATKLLKRRREAAEKEVHPVDHHYGYVAWFVCSFVRVSRFFLVCVVCLVCMSRFFRLLHFFVCYVVFVCGTFRSRLPFLRSSRFFCVSRFFRLHIVHQRVCARN